ncbi:hypothetical protein ALC60_07634 [Trachymyrmex zeteki]|uniref:Uncharacterized protein n=1 Tax=Mycetomoellerius zeteki TaxID=64791 RepID=A0A151WZA7_9HYME|nr:hypothetical protein ALC60_07634 [Trachymyrmex zeteki]
MLLFLHIVSFNACRIKIDEDFLTVLIGIQCWNLMLMLLLAKMHSKERRIRRWWVRPINYPRETQGIFWNHSYRLCNQQVIDYEEFFDYTRMDVQQFNYICDLVRPYLSKRSIRTPLSVELRMAITLE